MHVLIAKLIGRPAIENWRAHIADAEKSAAKLRGLAVSAGSHAARVDAAAKAFESDPTEKGLERWIELESKRSAAQAVSARIRDIAQGVQAAAIDEGGEAKLLAACDEAEAELNAQIEAIRAEDAERSERLGEEVSSPEPLRAIERLRRSIVEARRWRKSDLGQSVAHLQTVLNETR